MGQHQSTTDYLAALTASFGSESFTVEAARRQGFDLERIQRLARHGKLLRVRRGVYCLGESGRQRMVVAQVCADAIRQGGTPIIGGAAAAEEWGMSSGSAKAVVWVPRTSPLRRGNRWGVAVREGDIEWAQTAQIGGQIYTSPLRTAIDAACESHEPREIVWILSQGIRREMEWRLADSASKQVRASKHVRNPALQECLEDQGQRQEFASGLVEAVNRHHGRGIRRVRRLADVADPRLESPLEATSVLEFREHGVRSPQLQARVNGASGREYRVDFRWGRVIGEADGAVKYTTAENLWAEKRRQEDLERAGFIVIRWSWAEIVHEPARVIERINSALARA